MLPAPPTSGQKTWARQVSDPIWFSFLGSFRRQSCLDLYDVVSNGIHDQIPDGVKVQFPHEIDAVRFDGLGAQVQKTGNFLCGFAFREQLRDLTLACGQCR